MNEEAPPSEIRPELLATFEFAERIFRGDYGIELKADDESMDPMHRFSGPIVDFNDPDLTDQERAFAGDWIRRQLGVAPDEAAIKARYSSEDGTKVTLYDKALGQLDDPWYLSQWQNPGEEPSFILWTEEMYDGQLEMGFIEDATH